MTPSQQKKRELELNNDNDRSRNDEHRYHDAFALALGGRDDFVRRDVSFEHSHHLSENNISADDENRNDNHNHHSRSIAEKLVPRRSYSY